MSISNPRGNNGQNEQADKQADKLRIASNFKKPDVMDALIKAGADVNAADEENGMRPLDHAVWGGQPVNIDHLHRAGADVNASDEGGITPLHRAAALGKAASARALILKGAHIEAADARGNTPLHNAAAFDTTTATLKQLLEAGADVEAADSAGSRPLHKAADYANAEAVEALIKAGADVTATDGKGQTPLQVALCALRRAESLPETRESKSPKGPGTLIDKGGAVQWETVKLTDKGGAVQWKTVKLTPRATELAALQAVIQTLAPGATPQTVPTDGRAEDPLTPHEPTPQTAPRGEQAEGGERAAPAVFKPMTLWLANVCGQKGNTHYPRKAVITEPRQLQEATKFDSMCALYMVPGAPGSRRGGEGRSFVAIDTLYSDVDEGMSMADASAALRRLGIGGVLVSSKSHQKGKGGRPPCDCFHILAPLKETITDEAAALAALHTFQGFFSSDAGARDLTRFLFGNRLASKVCRYVPGEPFDPDAAYPPADGREGPGTEAARREVARHDVASGEAARGEAAPHPSPFTLQDAGGPELLPEGGGAMPPEGLRESGEGTPPPPGASSGSEWLKRRGLPADAEAFHGKYGPLKAKGYHTALYDWGHMAGGDGLEQTEATDVLTCYQRFRDHPEGAEHDERTFWDGYADGGEKRKAGEWHPAGRELKVRNYTPKEVLENGKEKVVHFPVQEPTPQMGEAARRLYHLSASGEDGPLLLRKKPAVLMHDLNSLSVQLAKEKVIFDIRRVDGAWGKQQIFEAIKDVSEKKTRLTCVPEKDMRDDTLFLPAAGKVFPEAEETGAFRGFVETFTFESVKDEYTAVFAALCLYLNSDYDGKIPLFVVRASGQSAGKSTFVDVFSEVLTGRKPIYIEEKAHSADNNAAQFAKIAGLSSRVVCYDNVKKMNTEEETRIAKEITLPVRRGWAMGTSRDNITNSFVYFMTLNDRDEGTLGGDLKARAITIRMRDPEKTGDAERNRLSEKMNWWIREENAQAVRADLRFILEHPVQTDGAEGVPLQKFSQLFYHLSGCLRSFYSRDQAPAFDFSPRAEDYEREGIAMAEVLEILFKEAEGYTTKVGDQVILSLTPTELFDLIGKETKRAYGWWRPQDFTGALKRAHDSGVLEGWDVECKKVKLKGRGTRMHYVIKMHEFEYEKGAGGKGDSKNTYLNQHDTKGLP